MNNLVEHWSGIHQNKDKDVSWWQENLWLDFLSYVSKSGAAIDVGAGQSPIALELFQNGFSPVYINDLAENALNNLVNVANSKNIQLTKIPGSILEISIPEKVTLWHDRAVFHFLTNHADIEKYKSQVLKNVLQNGYLVIATFSENGPNQCSGLDVKKYSPEELAEVFAPEFELVWGTKRTHVTPWDSEQEFSIVLMKKL